MLTKCTVTYAVRAVGLPGSGVNAIRPSPSHGTVHVVGNAAARKYSVKTTGSFAMLVTGVAATELPRLPVKPTLTVLLDDAGATCDPWPGRGRPYRPWQPRSCR